MQKTSFLWLRSSEVAYTEEVNCARLAPSVSLYRQARMMLAAILLLALPAARPQTAQPSSGRTTAAPSAASLSSKSASPAPDYSNEPLVVEHSATLCRYNADGTGTRTLQVTLHLQSAAAVRQFGVLSFPFAADDERVELASVRVRKADGTVIATDAAAAQDVPAEVTRQAPLYSDLHQLQLPVRSLAVGDRIEYEAVYHAFKANAPGQFWNALNFERQAVSLDQAIELRYPANLHVTVLSPKNKPAVSRDEADLVYRWHNEQREPTVAPPGGQAPDRDDRTFSTVPDVAWTTFPDWASVGEWYRALAGDRALPNDALRAKAAALTAGAATDDERIARIYSFVSMQIRYIGVDFGIGRFQPHSAADVFSNGYGDCKDKHTLLAALLTAAGFHAEPVLIGANIDMDRDLPAPNSFNHVITVVERRNGTRLWLDSTAEVAPVGMLVDSLRDKDALLVPTASNAPATLIHTPATPPFAAFDRYDSRGTIAADGKLSAHFTVTLRGDFELLTRAALFTSGRGGWAAVGQGVSSGLGFSGTVSAFQPTAVDTPEQPLGFTYDYQRDSLGDWPNHRIVALIPGALFSGATLTKEPDKPIQLGAPRTESSQSTLILPDGLTVPTMPSDLHAKASFGTFDVTYTLHGSELITEERLVILVPSIPAAEWQHYNTFIDDVTGNTGVFISLAEG